MALDVFHVGLELGLAAIHVGEPEVHVLDQWLEVLELLLQQLVGPGLLLQLGLDTLAEGLNLGAELLNGLALRLQSLVEVEAAPNETGIRTRSRIDRITTTASYPDRASLS